MSKLKECPEYDQLKADADRLAEALELSATPQDVTHTVHPKCFCSSCKQKQTLKEYRDKYGGEE